MAQRSGRRTALAMLVLMLCGGVLGHALGAGSSTIYTPVVLKGGPPPDNPTLVGNAAVLPLGWEVRPAQPRTYMIVLDVGGSMALNFNGQAVISGVVRQCGIGPDEALNQRRETDAPFCEASANDRWPVVEERRIYLVKQELMGMIDLLGPNDWMRIVAFSGVSPDAVAAVGDGRYGDTAGKAALKQAVLDAGKVNNDPYLTRGSKPTASALYKVRSLLGPSMPRQAPNGQTYQLATVLITDGVADHYRDTSNGAYLIDGATGPTVGWQNRAQDQQPQCAGDISDRVDCHIGYANTTRAMQPRPIVAMINEGIQLQQQGLVFVVALGNLRARNGFLRTASNNQYPWFAPLDQARYLRDTLVQIYDTSSSGFQPLPYTGWTYEIDPAHTPDPDILPGVDATTLGIATLTATDGLTRTAPIYQIQVGSSQRLSYAFENVPPGSYRISAWVGYKGDDGMTRRYRAIVNSDLTINDSRSIVVSSGVSLNNTIALEPLWLVCNEQSDPAWSQCTR